MVSLLCAAADLARQLAHLIRRRSRSERSRRRTVDDESEELPIDNVNTSSSGASTIPRRHRLKRPQPPLPSRLHPSYSASASVLPPPPMATSVGSRNNAGGRPPPAPTKPINGVVKDSKNNKDITPSLSNKASPSQKPIIIPNGIAQQKQAPVDSKNTIKDENQNKRVPAPTLAFADEHHHQIGRFSIIDERPKDPGSLESDFDDLDDSISSQPPSSPPTTGTRESSRSSTEPPASSSACISSEPVPNDPVIASSFSSGHLAMTAAAAHHHHLTSASSRFKIVPVDSTFKRGRWTCWDYYDTTDVSNGGAKGSLMKVASHPSKLGLLHRCDMIEYDKGRISQSCSRHGSGIHLDKAELLHHAVSNAALAHHDPKPSPSVHKDYHVVTFALGASEPSTPEDHTPTFLSPTHSQGHANAGSALATGASAAGLQTTPAKGPSMTSPKGPPTISPMAAAGSPSLTLKTSQATMSKMPSKATISASKPIIPINISVSPVAADGRSPSGASGHHTPGHTPRLAPVSGDHQLTINASHDFLSTPSLDRSLGTSHGERSLLENLLPGTIPPAGSPHNIGSADAWQQENTATQGAGGTPNMVAIDSKIEQAMDLVKTHLMFAVREEVEILRSKIVDLETTVLRLESENTVLRDHIPADTLSKLLTPPSSNQNTVTSTSAPPKATPA